MVDNKIDFKFESCNKSMSPEYIQKTIENNFKVMGVGPGEPIVVNDKGGKQSNSPYAFHLVDPDVIMLLVDEPTSGFIEYVTSFMKGQDKSILIDAIQDLAQYKEASELFSIAKVMKKGADRYEANNWRLIPQESHINHAIAHYLAWKEGDRQDDHISHCMCRLMMAYCTKTSPGFHYTSHPSSLTEDTSPRWYNKP